MTTIYDPKIKYRTATGWLDPLTGVESVIQWPTADNVGVYAVDPGWTPSLTITDDNLRITEAGTVIEDLHITNGVVLVFAPHVTVRRCLFTNASITNFDNPVINNGLVVEDCTFTMDPPGHEVPTHSIAQLAGFTLRRCAMLNLHEGLQTGGTGGPLADPTDPDGYAVHVYDTYLLGMSPGTGTEMCPEFHGDLLQPVDFGGTGGTEFIVRNSVFWCIDRSPYCGFCSSVDFYPGHCRPVDVDRMMLSGAGFSLRGDAGGSVKNMLIQQDAWTFGPVAIVPLDHESGYGWSKYTHWDCVTFDELDEDGQPLNILARVPWTWPYGPLAEVEPWTAPGLDTFDWVLDP